MVETKKYAGNEKGKSMLKTVALILLSMAGAGLLMYMCWSCLRDNDKKRDWLDIVVTTSAVAALIILVGALIKTI